MPYTSQYSLEKDCSVNDQPLCAEANPTVPFTGLTCMHAAQTWQLATLQNQSSAVDQSLRGHTLRQPKPTMSFG